MNKELKLEIFLKKSKLRRDVWKKLDKPKTATEICQEIGKHRSSVSRVLLDMKKQNFLKCVNSKDKSFRHYAKNE